MPAAKPSWLHKKLKLSHHRHSFKRLPHKHTSRGLLLSLTLISGIFMFWTVKSFTLNADALTGSGFLGLTGSVKPTTAATITEPVNKQIFNTNSADVSGTCPTIPPGNVVKIIDNGFTYTVPCKDGAYSYKIDLFPGVNYLRARVSDIYNQNGPDSTVIKVFYYYPAGTTNLPGGFNIGIESDLTAKASQAFSLKLKISGGQPPYAFNINWGDGNADVVSRNDQADFSAVHTYNGAGQFIVSVNSSDTEAQKASAQTVVLVTGPGLAAGPGQDNPIKPTYIDSTIKLLVPIYSVVAFGVFSFWLGQAFGPSGLLKLHKIRLFRH